MYCETLWRCILQVIVTTFLVATLQVKSLTVDQARLGDDAVNAHGKRKPFHPALERYLRELEAEYQRKAISFLSISSETNAHIGTDAHVGDNVLLIVYSDSHFYNTRLKWAKDTWIKQVDPAHLVVIGDAAAGPDFGVQVHETKCPPHSHWEGACCKYAEAVIEANKRMQQDPSLGWVYFLDDDTYLRPATLATQLAKLSPSPGHGRVAGYWGCGSSGKDGLCAGGGYAADREAISRMVNESPADFLREQMSYCSTCGQWADIAMSQIIKNRTSIDVEFIPGVYGWKLNKDDFYLSLHSSEPVLYHYMTNEAEFQFLHTLFGESNYSMQEGEHQELEKKLERKLSDLSQLEISTGNPKDTVTLTNEVDELRESMQALDNQLPGEGETCVAYKSNVACTKVFGGLPYDNSQAPFPRMHNCPKCGLRAA